MRLILCIAMGLGLTLFAAEPAMAAPPPYYPAVGWIPAASSNYDTGRSAEITTIVIHETDGPYNSVVNWFQNPWSQTSAHYLVRAWDGGITQFVSEADTAWHARSANPWTIGIETEFAPRWGIWHTDIQYRHTAQLACAIARRYGIPVDRAHIVGHNELPANDHSDPGPYWSWNTFMSYVRACATPRAQAIARASSVTREPSTYAPAAGLEYGFVGDDVALLQWDLVYLGFMAADVVSAGGGTFGPVTLDAVTAFQDANGLPTTGYYGDMTAGKLTDALNTNPTRIPAARLEEGDQSPAVTRLQETLVAFGYMDLVTGFYGPITRDAVARFQTDCGLEPTGAFDAITRMALAAKAR